MKEKLRVGGYARVVVDYRHGGQIGTVDSLTCKRDTFAVGLRFPDDPEIYGFQKNEVEPVSDPTQSASSTQTASSGSRGSTKRRLVEHWLLPTFVLLLGGYIGYMLGRTFTVPAPTAFWTEFGTPIATLGAGLFALVVGFAALSGVLTTSRGQQADNLAERWLTGRDQELARCWERFTWLAAASSRPTGAPVGADPGGFPPPVARLIIARLADDAQRQGDLTLAEALRTYILHSALQYAAVLKR
jgi:hypothetical protein